MSAFYYRVGKNILCCIGNLLPTCECKTKKLRTNTLLLCWYISYILSNNLFHENQTLSCIVHVHVFQSIKEFIFTQSKFASSPMNYITRTLPGFLKNFLQRKMNPNNWLALRVVASIWSFNEFVMNPLTKITLQINSV